MSARALLTTAILLLACAAARAAGAAWEFDKGIAGWRDEATSIPQTDQEGTQWPGSAAGVSLRSPDLKLPTQAFQVIELTLSMRSAGPAHLVWQGETQSGAAAGWQGGLPVQPPADGQLHELRLLPLWQNLRAITGLRLVGPPGLGLRLRSLRIVGPDAAPTAQTEWQFGDPGAAGQWLPLLGMAVVRRQADGAQVQPMDREVVLASPPLQTQAYRYEWLSAEITSREVVSARLQWATTAQRGLHGPELSLWPGRHTYNVHCGEEQSWGGQLAGLALTLASPNSRPADMLLHSLRLSNAPQGPADLRTTFAGPVEARVYAQRPFRLVWVLQNEGGGAAQAVQITATAEAAISIPPSPVLVERLPHGMPEPVTWLAKATGPGTVRLRADYGGRTLTEEVKIEPVAVAEGEESAREPAVRPGTDPAGSPLVLAHLHEAPAARWGPATLDRMLYRRPWLGDYELQPEVVDWQVKWALEHGLGGFIVDYRQGEARALDAWLGSPLARQAKLLLRWTEPVPAATGARALLAELAPVIAQPNYARWQGKPLLIVGNSLQRGAQGWGLSDLQAVAAEGQVALIAAVPLSVAAPELLQRAGYAAAADLHTEAALPASQSVVEAWEEAAQRKVPHVLSLQPAWQADLTPQRLQTLLRIALLRARRGDSLALPMVIVGDWNGERGIEPRRPEGTQWLEAVAAGTAPSATSGATPSATSGATRLLLPSDVGIEPYDRTYPGPPRSWEFEAKETWTSAMGLSVLRILNGQLTGRTDSSEPAVFGGETMLDTRPYRAVLIGLAVSDGKRGRLWWRTSLRKFTVEHSLSLELVADGAVHEYRLDMSAAPGWDGYLEGFRLDPTDAAGAAVALDYVRVVP